MPDDPAVRAYIKQLYEMAGSAAKGKADINFAVSHNLAQHYHRALKAHPETKYIGALQSAKRHIGTLLAAKRDLTKDTRTHPDIKALKAKNYDNTIGHVAEGVVRWTLEKMGAPRPPPNHPPPPPPPPPPQPGGGEPPVQ